MIYNQLIYYITETNTVARARKTRWQKSIETDQETELG
jgi:hypothetical protein